MKLFVWLAILTLYTTGAARAAAIVPAQPIGDPLPLIAPAGITVALEPFVTVPGGAPQLLQPVGDGSGRLAIDETGGRIYLTTKAGGTLGAPYLDVSTAAAGFDRNLMGLAFSPDFATSGKFYTAYHATPGSGIAPLPSSTPGNSEIVIREWTASIPGAAAFSGTSREVVRVGLPNYGHTVGMIAFNPNAKPGDADYGNLYVGMGDSGNSGTYVTTAQDLSVPYGKILRINPKPSGGNSYTVPADNPFVGQAGKESLVWASGLRNPQYFSWRHGGDGRMYINDIGESTIEEVDTGIAGGNYGWSTREGTYATWRDPSLGVGPSSATFQLQSLPEPGLLFPIAEYDHQQGAAIGSGLPYQGTAIPALIGKYIVSDIVGGYLFVTDVNGLVSTDIPGTPQTFSELGVDYNGVPTTILDVIKAGRADLRLGVDDDGELYALTKASGQIFRLTTASAIPAPDPAPVLVTALAALALLRGRFGMRRPCSFPEPDGSNRSG